MHALTATPVITPADRLGLTAFLAVAAHLVVILGITFVEEDRGLRRAPTLDVILVQKSAEEAPEDVDFLAQANQDGGGEHDTTERPSTPLPSPLTGDEPSVVSATPPLPPTKPSPESPRPSAMKAELAPPEPAPKPVLSQRAAPSEHKVERARKPAPESDARTVSHTDKPNPESREVASRPEPEMAPQPTETVSAAALVSRSLAMASLNAEINRRLKAYAERPRRKWITARTRQHKYAAYMEAWRQKVERIGNLNYPDEARRRKLSGNLLLDVALNPDGSINEITMRRSSGQRVLDDAAVRIVKLAAPYAKFPDDIRNEVDILHIERTWQFLSGDRFVSR